MLSYEEILKKEYVFSVSEHVYEVFRNTLQDSKKNIEVSIKNFRSCNNCDDFAKTFGFEFPKRTLFKTEEKYKEKLEEFRKEVSKIEKAYYEYCCVYMLLVEADLECTAYATCLEITKDEIPNRYEIDSKKDFYIIFEEISFIEKETRTMLNEVQETNRKLARKLLEKRLKEIIDFSKNYDCVVCVISGYTGVYELMNRLRKKFEGSAKEFIVISEDGKIIMLCLNLEIMALILLRRF